MINNEEGKNIAPYFYIDTCILSELAKFDSLMDLSSKHAWKLEELKSAKKLFEFASKGLARLCRCIDSQIELKLPPYLLEECQKFITPLSIAPVAKGYLGVNTYVGHFRVSGTETDAFHSKIMRALRLKKYNTDSHLLLTAIVEGVTGFVTIDDSTILKYRDDLLKETGIVVISPSEAVRFVIEKFRLPPGKNN